MTRDKTRIYSIPHDAPCRHLMIVTKRESIASLIHLNYDIVCNEVIIRACIMDSEILYHLVTIIKRLVHHAVYCISLSCLLSFLSNPYILFLIYEIFHLLVSFHFFTAFSSESYRTYYVCTGAREGQRLERAANKIF